MGDEKRFATSGSLGGDEDCIETRLPFMGEWVHVRHLSTPEVARLSYLPDLLGFSMLMAKLQVELAALSKGEKPKEEVDPGALAAENYRYQAHVAHLAVVKDPTKLDDQPCASCDFEHPASLWTVRQTERLQPKDLEAINRAALNAKALEQMRPLSKDETQPDSSAPAGSGAPTPPTSS